MYFVTLMRCHGNNSQTKDGEYQNETLTLNCTFLKST